MLERIITSDPAIPIQSRQYMPMGTPLIQTPPLTPVQELENRDRLSFENSKKFMPLNTIEGLTVAVQDIRESLIEIKNAISQIRTDDIKALHKESDDFRRFQSKLVGAGSVVALILVILIGLGAYFSGRWESAYSTSQNILNELPGIISTGKTNTDEIDKIHKKLDDADAEKEKEKLATRMNDAEQKILDLEITKKPVTRATH